LYASLNIIRIVKSRSMRLAGHAARTRKMRNLYKIVVGKHEGKRTLGRRSRRWGDNIRMDLKEIGLKGVGLNHLTQERVQWRAVVNTVMNLWVT